MIDVSKMGIEEILTCLREKKFTCKELVEYYISNIEKYSGKNAILQVFDDAVEKAEEADAKLNSGEELPSLCGLPIIIKDNILYEGKICSCSLLLEGRDMRLNTKTLSININENKIALEYEIYVPEDLENYLTRNKIEIDCEVSNTCSILN